MEAYFDGIFIRVDRGESVMPNTATITFWLVQKANGSVPTFRHSSQEAAEREASRLVEQSGGECIVLEAKSIVKPARSSVVVRLTKEAKSV